MKGVNCKEVGFGRKTQFFLESGNLEKIQGDINRGFIKGRAQGKLTVCEHGIAQLFLTLGFQHDCSCQEHVHPCARVLSPDALLLQILMNPLHKVTVATLSGLPQSGKCQGKTKIFQGQGKVREFFKRWGKILEVCKGQWKVWELYFLSEKHH